MFVWLSYHWVSLVLLVITSFLLVTILPLLVNYRGLLHATIVLLLAYIMGAALLTLVHDGSPTFVQEAGTQVADGSGKPRTISYFAPMQSDADLHSKQLRDEWRPYANQILLVSVDPANTDGRQVVEKTYQRLLEIGNDDVLIICASLGAGLGLDLLDYNADHGGRLRLKFIAIDPARGIQDIRPQQRALALVMSFFSPELVLNWLLRPLIRRMHKPPPTDSNVDKEILEAHYEVGRTWPASGFSSQLRYIIWRTGAITQRARNVPFRLLRAAHDEMISESANTKWLHGFNADYSHMKIMPNANHVDFENPDRWRAGFKWALRGLYPAG